MNNKSSFFAFTFILVILSILGGLNFSIMHKIDKMRFIPTPSKEQVVSLRITSSDQTPLEIDPFLEEDMIAAMMTVKNPEGELNSNCSVINGIGYRTFFSTITQADVNTFWQDCNLMVHKYGVEKVVIQINSGGGSVPDGFALSNLIQILNDMGIETEGFACGIVASAAVPILASCSHRIATRDCVFMVHKSKIFKYIASETTDDLIAQKEMMELTGNKYINILVENSDLSADEWREKIDKTSWFSADKAFEWGLIDELK
jgi:ATP-dependent protease ClpP protease subunit